MATIPTNVSLKIVDVKCNNCYMISETNNYDDSYQCPYCGSKDVTRVYTPTNFKI